MISVARAIAVAVALLGSTPAWAADKTVSFWAPKGTSINTTEAKLVVVSKEPGTQKLTKACAKNGGKFDRWTVMATEPAGGAPSIISIVSEPLQEGKGVRLASLRAEGECKDGTMEWTKYSAVVQQEKKAKPAEPAPTPKTEKKKNK